MSLIIKSKDQYLQVFRLKFCIHFSSSCVGYRPYPSHSLSFVKVHQLWHSSLCNFLHPPISFPSPNILLSILFANTFNLYSYLQVWDQVLHQQNMKDTVFQNLSFQRRWENKRLWISYWDTAIQKVRNSATDKANGQQRYFSAWK